MSTPLDAYWSQLSNALNSRLSYWEMGQLDVFEWKGWQVQVALAVSFQAMSTSLDALESWLWYASNGVLVVRNGAFQASRWKRMRKFASHFLAGGFTKRGDCDRTPDNIPWSYIPNKNVISNVNTLVVPSSINYTCMYRVDTYWTSRAFGPGSGVCSKGDDQPHS